MERNTPRSTSGNSWEPVQLAAIVGIILAGVAAALTMPIWIAAICCLVAGLTLRAIATTSLAVQPVVIRRDRRR